jgi:hypothetical protein
MESETNGWHTFSFSDCRSDTWSRNLIFRKMIPSKIDWDRAQSLTHVMNNNKTWKKNFVSDIHSAILNFSAILDLRDA